MANEATRDALISLANDSSGNPSGFLEGLSGIHDEWHQPFGRNYGFLLFHFRVVRYFNDIVGPVIVPAIQAYTKADFEGMGYNEFGGGTAGVDSLGELSSYSSAIESWHNVAHARMQTATGVPMMDARQNIYFRPFWRLHAYIDDQFQIVLKQYGDNVHAGQFLTLQAVASHIETSHHSWVPSI